MLDLFTIFTKGGIVLWCFRGTKEIFTPPVNALIRSVILQERTGSNSFDYKDLTVQYKLDNEFELIFVVAYQKILQLTYVDKFLSDVHLEFRDKYKNVLVSRHDRSFLQYDFLDDFNRVLEVSEKWGRSQAKLPKSMRTFDESQKSKKTVASMIERRDGKDVAPPKKNVKIVEVVEEPDPNELTEDVLMENRRKMAEKLSGKKKADSKKSPKTPKTPTEKAKPGKQARVWEFGGSSKDAVVLDRSKDKPEDMRSDFTSNNEMIGSMKGGIQDLEVESDDEFEENDSEEENDNKNKLATKSKSTGKNSVFSMFSKFVGAKNLTREDMVTVLDKLRDHLISKNVANYIANELCDSVAVKLEGKVLGTFDTIASTVRNALTEALVQILSPKRRIDILRDCLEAKKNQRPYVITFCGVNGVGKSTNLAKICFWLIENNFNVLIAACDTFRAGAVEQLRTHMRHLNALHPPAKHGGREMVQLYEKGYGKDAAGIAMEAIRFAHDSCIDVVLVDTAGRMQDNEPLMRALTKLISVNEPDLVLFVGEALVGNEAVDQLTKFNQALADHSNVADPHLIDGIVLTKFDTIDDKVGASISMTYITGQPIVFVGTGQTYTDLKALNAKAVVHALMK
ncbi:signal recognition particle receptor subunit alpha homolog [Contarinia nasturtii]|uniref:signal recognition particle receptor subunit alpha homolog n=1 Tax=Contarinia nasturtii TaxID=265458 RepID=UPI0012D3C90B|nr:signal recognition particle receptor subunit alpha homolog [Contarinia nasturtii]